MIPDEGTIGVVGAGVIGTGVCQAFAESGFHVVAVDVDPAQLQRSRNNIQRGIRLRSLLRSASTDREVGPILDRIRFTSDPGALASSGWLIENVTERWDTKARLYPELDRICPPTTRFAVNTSAIPITRVAGLTQRPERVVGMHFMNPVPLMSMVEVVRGRLTSDETIEAAKRLLSTLGRECIVVSDSPGFVTNRVMMLTVNEAAFLLQEGVARSAEDVDRLFKTCFGHRMGPLETADLIGLDTVLLSLEVLRDETGDPKFRPCPLLRNLVYAGMLGRKSGEGFHSYEGAGASSPPQRRESDGPSARQGLHPRLSG